MKIYCSFMINFLHNYVLVIQFIQVKKEKKKVSIARM